MSSFVWPGTAASPNAVPSYANLASFPAAAGEGAGALGVALDVSALYESDGTAWQLIGSKANSALATAATSLDTVSTLVKRDGSGNFAAGTITAALTGAASLNVLSTAVGASSGVASLDSGGKVPLAQLPASLMEYQGTWNATTNSPTLADGTGTSGYFYRANVAGTQNLGSGSQTFVVGDWVMYNGTIWQLAHSGADAVVSVNGAAGVVTVNALNQLTGDVTAAAATGSASGATTVAKIAGVAVGTPTGTTNVVFSNGPTLVAPVLGTPASGNLSNCTSLPAGALPALTGDVTSSAGSAATTVAKIAGVAVGTPTGTTNAVFSNGPTLVAPVLGTPASGNLSNCTAYPTAVPGTSAGLIAAAGVPGNTTGNAIATGFVGETISASITSNFSATTTQGTYTDVTGVTIILSAGIWQMVAMAPLQMTWSSGSGTTVGLAFIRTSGNANVVGMPGIYANSSSGPLASGTATLMTTVNITSSTTYKLSVIPNTLTGAPVINVFNCNGSLGTAVILYAVRIA